MKKLLLLAIAFLAFTGFTNNNVKELDFDSTSLVMSPQSLLLPPSIKDAEPSNREVIVKEGTTASFSIAYESAESADVEITRQGSSLGENCTYLVKETEVKVMIINTKVSDSGRYVITITNKAGSSSINFTVLVAEDI